MILTFEHLATVNLQRCTRWHAKGLYSWSHSDWATAMAGEAGEVCNAVKKLNRIRDQMPNISEPDRQLTTVVQAIDKIAEELADTVIYCDLLAQRCSIDLAAAIVRKFNAVSEAYGFPERLAA